MTSCVAFFSDVGYESSVGDLQKDSEEFNSRFTAFVNEIKAEIERVQSFNIEWLTDKQIFRLDGIEFSPRDVYNLRKQLRSMRDHVPDLSDRTKLLRKFALSVDRQWMFEEKREEEEGEIFQLVDEAAEFLDEMHAKKSDSELPAAVSSDLMSVSSLKKKLISGRMERSKSGEKPSPPTPQAGGATKRRDTAAELHRTILNPEVEGGLLRKAAQHPQREEGAAGPKRGFVKEMKNTPLAQETLHEHEDEEEYEDNDWFPDSSDTAESSVVSEMSTTAIKDVIMEQAKAIRLLKERLVDYITNDWERDLKFEMTELQREKMAQDLVQQSEKIESLETALQSYFKSEDARHKMAPVRLSTATKTKPAKPKNTPKET